MLYFLSFPKSRKHLYGGFLSTKDDILVIVSEYLACDSYCDSDSYDCSVFTSLHITKAPVDVMRVFCCAVDLRLYIGDRNLQECFMSDPVNLFLSMF